MTKKDQGERGWEKIHCSQHVCVCVCSAFFNFIFIILYVDCFGRTMLYMYKEYHIQITMYHVSAQDIDEHMINVHYYYYLLPPDRKPYMVTNSL